MSMSGISRLYVNGLIVVGEMPSNLDRLIHIHYNTIIWAHHFISVAVMIQTWYLHSDIQFEGGDKVWITPILVRF